MSNRTGDIFGAIFTILMFIILFGFLGYFAVASDTPDKTNIKKCTNIKKLYKDDILFDNFYIGCNETINLEVTPELYTRIVEGENYIVTYNKLGGLYSIVKEEGNSNE